jgi:hypothetical protein
MSGRLRHAEAGGKRRVTLLNSRDIAALNRAREVLKRVEDAAWRRSLDHYDPYAPVTAWDLGRLSGAASVADEAIFHVLSTARNNCHLNVTDAQLFGTERAPAQAEPALENGTAHRGARARGSAASAREAADQQQSRARGAAGRG